MRRALTNVEALLYIPSSSHSCRSVAFTVKTVSVLVSVSGRTCSAYSRHFPPPHTHTHACHTHTRVPHTHTHTHTHTLLITCLKYIGLNMVSEIGLH